jgi:regulation of enolase protein 1 (concanavalin A-like superfamily)
MRYTVSLLLGLAAACCFSAAAADDKKPQEIKGWGTVEDPEGDSKITEEKGKLTIKLPGAYRDLWADKGAVQAPRLLQEIEGDFIVHVKVSGEVKAEKGTLIPNIASTVAFRAGTLLIWQDNENFVRLDRASAASKDEPVLGCHLQAFKNKKTTIETSKKLEDKDTHLRLERKEGHVKASFSQDGGKTWETVGDIKIDLPKKVKVGVSALNTMNKPFEIVFEDFKTELIAK